MELQDVSAGMEGVTWEPLSGKLSGFTCRVSGRDWGCIMRSRTAAQGEGWTSTFAGFHTDLEKAKAAHAAAVHARKAELAKPVEPQAVPATGGGMTAEQYCRMRGRVFIDYKLRRLKRMDERHEPRPRIN